MGLTVSQIQHVETVLKGSLRNKFQNYNPEPAAKPFHTRLLGGNRLALYAFIHSLMGNFGTAVFEPVAVTIAKDRFKRAVAHTKSGQIISEQALFEIQRIMNSLETATTTPDKVKEISSIRRVCQMGTLRKVRPTDVDLLIETNDNELYLFDLKTVKPNAGGFREFKRTLLEWVAIVLAENPHVMINTVIAMPYNPDDPQPYHRWTMRGMLDLEHELKVGEEFWDFLGGEGAYKDLLDCFERVGIELRDEIDQYFTRFSR